MKYAPRKATPDPEEVPPEARYTARGLKRWIEARRARGIRPEGNPIEPVLRSENESCILHDHDE